MNVIDKMLGVEVKEKHLCRGCGKKLKKVVDKLGYYYTCTNKKCKWYGDVVEQYMK